MGGDRCVHGARRWRVTAVLLVVTALLFSACDAGWTDRLGDAGHGSRSADTGITASNAATLKRLWRRQAPSCPGGTGGGGWLATPVTFQGVIYIGSNHGCLFALRESDGSVIWSKFAGFQPRQTCGQRLGIVSSAVVRNEAGGPVLYFHSPDGYLYKLAAADGAAIWKKLVQIPAPDKNDVYAWSSPTVVGGKVIIGVSSNCDIPFVQGQVRAYDQQTGDLLWLHKMVPDGFVGAGDWYDAAVDDAGDVYVSTGSTTNAQAEAHPNTDDGFEQYSVLKLSGADGHLVWKAPLPIYKGDPDYASSPILFVGGGVPMVGATNKDGWFYVYRRSDGAPTWKAKIGTGTPEGITAALAGGVWDGSHLYLMSNGTKVGGTWAEGAGHAWTPVGGTAAAGSIRQLDPATGALVSVGGARFELALPSNILGPCSINGNSLLICSGGDLRESSTAHTNGVFIIDTTKAPSVLKHLEDVHNYGGFSQPVTENGAILAGNTDALVKYGH
jgi:outer membrane protein assembly factor BamB